MARRQSSSASMAPTLWNQSRDTISLCRSIWRTYPKIRVRLQTQWRTYWS
jgi:hypothetical protein